DCALSWLALLPEPTRPVDASLRVSGPRFACLGHSLSQLGAVGAHCPFGARPSARLAPRTVVGGEVTLQSYLKHPLFRISDPARAERARNVAADGEPNEVLKVQHRTSRVGLWWIAAHEAPPIWRRDPDVGKIGAVTSCLRCRNAGRNNNLSQHSV